MSEIEMSSPQEWWIQLGTPDIIAESFQEADSFNNPHRIECPWHHVVEYSALDHMANCFAAEQDRRLKAEKERDEARKFHKDHEDDWRRIQDAERALEIERAKSAKLVEALERIVGTVDQWTDERGFRQIIESDGSLTARQALAEHEST